MHRNVISVLGVILLLGIIGCSDSSDYGTSFELPEEARKNDEVTLKFGRIPSETVTGLLRENSPLISLLGESLGVNITFRFADDYNGIIEGMSKYEYDFVWLGPYSYVLSSCASRNSSDYKPLVRPVRPSQNGRPGDSYQGIIFTNRNTSIDELEDLRGETVAFVEPQSTSGYLFPKSKMLQQGINTDQDLAEVKFLKRHDRVVREVLSGEAAAGAVYRGARYNELEKKNNRIDEILPVLATTDTIPTSPIAVSGQLASNNSELVEKFTKTMLDLNESSRGRKIIRNQRMIRYKKASSSDYATVAKVFKRLRSTMPKDDNLCKLPIQI